VHIVRCDSYACSAGGMRVEGVRGPCPACMLLWLLSTVSAGGVFLAAYKFHAKLLFVLCGLLFLCSFSLL
jgi:hypothetical protein